MLDRIEQCRPSAPELIRLWQRLDALTTQPTTSDAAANAQFRLALIRVCSDISIEESPGDAPEASLLEIKARLKAHLAR